MGSGNKKRVVIVTNSSSYEPRAERIGQYFVKNNCSVLWIESDFIHREKIKGRNKTENHIYLDTVVYRKNVSIRRLYSQYDFAKKTEKILAKLEIDLLYVLLPANSLAPAAVRFKKKNPNLQLVFDIIDLWPESLPVNKNVQKAFPFQYWKKLRDNYIRQADLIVTECNLYKAILGLGAEEAVTLYWPKNEKANRSDFQADPEYIHMAYLGSINNIIDINAIVEILEEVNKQKRVKFHVIGSGEKEETFLQILEQKKIETKYYGSIYDESQKREILSRCSFGFNMMKSGICVGLTMKSIDYFCYGLPLINNIPGDTWEIVEKYGIGVNCSSNNYTECAKQILKGSDIILQKKNRIYHLYNEYFTVESMEKKLEHHILPLLKEKG